MKYIEKLRNFRKNYPEQYSREREVIDNVVKDLIRATTSLAPHCGLELAESEVNCYEIYLERTGNSCPSLIRRLRNSISDAYNHLMPLEDTT